MSQFRKQVGRVDVSNGVAASADFCRNKAKNVKSSGLNKHFLTQ
ncbi:hypothetical protein F542_14670 [Bibersteinia trehalosi USDA-ARS-USMARC-188]|uniref:Uncharacterized protein n=2 Tax=Bibersteinia trehalosi TaxID=47735 RepID=A0A4V7IAY1_BIBTR|nr:hypothetical protein WQG_7380 [Bibersteinia trehalosi USDA-ARS-USMARC-192]AHG82183.1 hypothetical protein F542_14670 [Bibersteinia trehalosi USDA-ARS-USMARC-188]AHG84495.1 hypothetical protein F543_16330 [Bibersteinia trehalosi USDA-ARS-USMARC-189]